MRSLAVSKSLQGKGLGRKLIASLLDDARLLQVNEVFTLTFVPEFFSKLGFVEIDRSTLPHKVWQECTRCPLFPDCGETAMVLKGWA